MKKNFIVVAFNLKEKIYLRYVVSFAHFDSNVNLSK